MNIHVNKQKGFSIVELMVAVTIGLIIVTGLVIIFDTTAGMNRTQNGMARLQENGRYAVVQLRQNLEQAGYQYCFSSSTALVGTNQAVFPLPWLVHSSNLGSGLPTRADVVQTPAAGVAPNPYLVDTSYFIHGHECSSGTCLPGLTSLGSATAFTVPAVGTGDGQRIAGTDVLTFRYISGGGRDVSSVDTSIPGVATINFTQNAITNNPVIPAVGDKVVLARCDGRPASVVELQASSASVAQAAANGLAAGSPSALIKMFSLSADTATLTYYVANNVVGGRDIPTLYSVINGVSNPVIEGVDRFDVIYGVKNESGDVLLLDADGVQNLAVTECVGQPDIPVQLVTGQTALSNIAGCGWRSVVSIEVHLLLNTIYDSSTNANDEFVYSIDGNAKQTPSNLPSTINHYKMFRREFVASVALKNY